MRPLSEVTAVVRYETFDAAVTLPYTSTDTLLYVLDETPVVARSKIGLRAVPVFSIRVAVPVADETLFEKVLKSDDERTPVAVLDAVGIDVVETDETLP